MLAMMKRVMNPKMRNNTLVFSNDMPHTGKLPITPSHRTRKRNTNEIILMPFTIGCLLSYHSLNFFNGFISIHHPIVHPIATAVDNGTNTKANKTISSIQPEYRSTCTVI